MPVTACALKTLNQAPKEQHRWHEVRGCEPPLQTLPEVLPLQPEEDGYEEDVSSE
jgi:hypothetical protein